MAGNQLLFLKLAEALGQDSRALRAVRAGAEIPFQAIAGYDAGAQFGDRIRQRKLNRQTLSDALGGQPLETGIMNMTGEGGDAQNTNIDNLIALERSRKEAAIRDARAQQANFQLDGKLMEYDPDRGYYPARILDGESSTSAPDGRSMQITPRVPPTVPAAETSKFGDLFRLKTLVNTASKNYSDKYTGASDSLKTRIRQFSGKGAEEKAAFFNRSVNDMSDSLLRARSGAAINEAEYARLRKLIPSQYTSDSDFLGRLEAFDQDLSNTISQKREAFTRSGYRTSDFGEVPQGIQEFSTPEEAEASGVKGVVRIGGRRAVIY